MAAIELFSSSSSSANYVADTPMSPRISFSHDFVEEHPLPSNSSSAFPTIDFDFCVRRESFDDHDSSSADELFSHGRIIPTQIKNKKKNNKYNHPPLKQQQTDQSLLLPPSPRPQGVRENASTTKKTALKKESDHNHQNQKSFWGFKRSSSCGSGYGRSLCPLPLLSRSYSTGSKEGKNSNAQKLHASSSSSFGPNTYYKKPPLKKCYGSYGNSNIGGVGVNPVILNVPSANLFGFGSFFSKNRDKAKRK